ncbi:hypothetical protein GCM10017600_30980 [Streptosporangium carneum]|uniref:N-acetyltransferase domain-containing protein n=2 Tax=Streptosporangium carneum TaxID=47481 RepID=A0A9W6I0D4_9ACTN|nr:GNAT family N-acetyltransferase [Streptosporangium carneum]GLK09692.1 hypothetical protein GCM10017600_30980 [Streptosporangium carneum]
MRTASTRKRSGIASLPLEHIITEAGGMGFTRLSLETGAAESFRPARRLYEKFGFDYREPFADHRPDPYSVFVTRVLLEDPDPQAGTVASRTSGKPAEGGRLRKARPRPGQPGQATLEEGAFQVLQEPARPDL